MPDKSDDFVELAVEKDIDKTSFHPRKLRHFVSHLSASAIKAEERSAKKLEVREKLEKIKSLTLNKRSTKDVIETEFGSFEEAVHAIINDEEKILSEQRKETRQINELRDMVELLSKKLISIGREYAHELEEKDKKIFELREALASAHIRISESGEARKRKIESIEKKIKSREPGQKTKSDQISEVESHIESLEKMYRELKKKGLHSKSDLERIEKMIESQKMNIKRLKAKKK